MASLFVLSDCWLLVAGETELESCVALITFPIVWLLLLRTRALEGTWSWEQERWEKISTIYHAMTCAVTSHMTHIDHLK